jgi:limonene-1,2-epoxide hydrolase
MNRYMGAMEFRDGKIARWRDYFQLNRPPAA